MSVLIHLVVIFYFLCSFSSISIIFQVFLPANNVTGCRGGAVLIAFPARTRRGETLDVALHSGLLRLLAVKRLSTLCDRPPPPFDC